MFHQGSLQSGISLAIQEQKLVACFVRDDGEESADWENDWLQSGWVANLLAQKAVLLRIEAGSTEAGFLSAFCPVSNVPILVVIKDGKLQEQLTRGISKDDFVNRIRKVLGAPPIPSAAQPTATPPQTSTPDLTEESSPSEPMPQSRIPEPRESTPTPPPPSAKAKGKQRAVAPEPTPEVTATDSVKQKARDALRKKKHEEKEELERIKARIEADKAERRAQAEARKAERERQAQQSSPTTSQFPKITTTRGTRGSQAKEVHLNVRLFDGHTIRSTFPRTANLQDDVRPWIDQEFAANAEHPRERHPPYYFKQILAPLPSRELSAGEESETLGDIDLAPSATLVLIPIKGYTEAYSGGGGGIAHGAAGGVMSLVGGAFNLVGSAIGAVTNTLGSIIGGGGAGTQQETQPAPGRTVGEAPPPQQDGPDASSIRVRTLADQRAREPRSQQLYNGNQLNFEPRDEETNR